MGNNFSVYGKDYRISVEVENNFKTLALKVHKVKKQKGDGEFAFYKRYNKQDLPQDFKQFQSVKDLYEYLQKNKDTIEIIGTSLVVPLNGNQVYVLFQNKSEQSKIFVQGVNQQIKEGQEALQNLTKLTELLQAVQLIKNNAIENNPDDDLEFVYAKLYSFYDKLCDKNPQRKKTQKLSMIQLVDSIVAQYDFLQNQRSPIRSSKQVNMKKIKPALQNSEQIQKLQKQITSLKVMLDASKQNFQTVITESMRRQIEDIDKMRKQEETKQTNQVLTRIERYIHDKRSQILKSSVTLIRIRFQKQEDLKSFIVRKMDEIQQLKYDVLQQKNNVRLLQKQIEFMRNGSSINFSNISGQEGGKQQEERFEGGQRKSQQRKQ